MANRLQQARRLLKSSDPEERGEGCGLLFGLCSKSALRLGLQAMEDEDPGVRGIAVLAIVFHHEGIDPVITHLLNDPDENVRRTCADFLGSRDVPEVFVALRQALTDPSEKVHLTACNTLYRLGERDALLNATRYPSPSLRLQACKRLIVEWKDGNEEVIASLEELASNPIGQEYDKEVVVWHAFNQKLFEEGHMDVETRDLNIETWRPWQRTVAELIEEARRLMAADS